MTHWYAVNSGLDLSGRNLVKRSERICDTYYT
jgi:hypothetical protein